MFSLFFDNSDIGPNIFERRFQDKGENLEDIKKSFVEQLKPATA